MYVCMYVCRYGYGYVRYVGCTVGSWDGWVKGTAPPYNARCWSSEIGSQSHSIIGSKSTWFALIWLWLAWNASLCIELPCIANNIFFQVLIGDRAKRCVHCAHHQCEYCTPRGTPFFVRPEYLASSSLHNTTWLLSVYPRSYTRRPDIFLFSHFSLREPVLV